MSHFESDDDSDGDLDPAAATGWHLSHYDEVVSTQELAWQSLRRDPAHCHAVVATRQAGGRGRRGNDWHSPDGGLWMSAAFVVDDALEFPRTLFGLLAASAVLRALRELVAPEGRRRLGLKWPNDLVVDDRKWGGVLSESSALRGVSATASEAGRAPLFGAQAQSVAIVVGIGLNLRVPRSELRAFDSASSIAVEFGDSPSPRASLSRILPRLAAAIDDAGRDHRGHRALREISADMTTLGREVRWSESSGRERSGRATGLLADGGLRVRGAAGESFDIRAGEVHHVRTSRASAPSEPPPPDRD